MWLIMEEKQAIAALGAGSITKIERYSWQRNASMITTHILVSASGIETTKCL
ncbi:MAG: hypothetical protein MSS92_04985 [Lachnospiraceae bacterium]|nr:hypothetical protein [Lachnospiraceae bacterium]